MLAAAYVLDGGQRVGRASLRGGDPGRIRRLLPRRGAELKPGDVPVEVAAFGALLRVFGEALPGIAARWRGAVAALAVLPMVLGNLGALAQSDLERMLTWSSIAHTELHAHGAGSTARHRGGRRGLLPRRLRWRWCWSPVYPRPVLERAEAAARALRWLRRRGRQPSPPRRRPPKSTARRRATPSCWRGRRPLPRPGRATPPRSGPRG